MTRREAFAILGAGGLLTLAGLVWLCGPWGLLVPGVALMLGALFGLDISTGGARGQSLANPARPVRR